MLFEDEKNMLYKCIYCNKLFSCMNREWMVCPKAKIFIDFHGKVIAEHMSDRSWDINKFIHFLRQMSLSWREIYWKIYARLLKFKCTICDQYFLGSEIPHCSYHPLDPKFQVGSNSGV